MSIGRAGSGVAAVDPRACAARCGALAGPATTGRRGGRALRTGRKGRATHGCDGKHAADWFCAQPQRFLPHLCVYLR